MPVSGNKTAFDLTHKNHYRLSDVTLQYNATLVEQLLFNNSKSMKSYSHLCDSITIISHYKFEF